MTDLQLARLHADMKAIKVKNASSVSVQTEAAVNALKSPDWLDFITFCPNLVVGDLAQAEPSPGLGASAVLLSSGPAPESCGGDPRGPEPYCGQVEPRPPTARQRRRRPP